MSRVSRTVKLTKRAIDGAKPEDRRYSIWDTEKRGLGVRVEVSGLKVYILRYRAGKAGRNAPRREMVLGRCNNWSPEKARKEAGRLMNEVDGGKDPALERHQKRRELDVAQLCDLYLEEGTATKKPSTIATDKGRIERHIKPLLGKKPVGEVSMADVERFMRDVAKGKTATDLKTKARGRAIVEGGKGTATRTVGLLGGIFSFAVRHRLRSDNPVRGVKRYRDQKGERFLSSLELGSLGEALRAIEAEGANSQALAIIRLLTFTGARKSEISTLKWSEVDIERQCLRLGDSKTGAKVIPLGPPALAILSELPRENALVFPAETGARHFQGTEKIWRKVRERAGLPGLRIHDLRHSFASIGLVTGDALPVIGKLLGHADTKTTARYAHLADDPLKAAANRISGTIAAALNSLPTAEILPLVKPAKAGS
jgi:integrase